MPAARHLSQSASSEILSAPDAHATPGEQRGHQLGRSLQERDEGSDCVTGPHHSRGALGVSASDMDTVFQTVIEGVRVEAHQGMHRLVLGSSSDVALHSEINQERLHLGCSLHKVRMRPLAVATPEADDPFPRSACNVDGGVMKTESHTALLEECGWWASRWIRHISTLSQGSAHVKKGHRAT
jgi:hypothetical protein